ncbi:hypothetical protein CIB48_g9271 [Xylaria polymorpha]|nr:hypothetical protein CIB48_g9271 [Xylaria polymorpha]
MLSLAPGQERDVESLQNWLGGTGCLAREETEYLTSQELMSLAPTSDSALTQFETWVEGKFIQFYTGFRKSFVSVLDPLLLLTPVVICNIISTISGRIVIVIASTVFYLVILSGLTKSRTMELTVAGATYVAPLFSLEPTARKANSLADIEVVWVTPY